jgi:hypothetical protein
VEIEGYGATIHLYRQPALSAGAVAFFVWIDGVERGKIQPRERIKLSVGPGDHRIQMSMWSRQRSQTLSFQVAAGQAVGFSCQGSGTNILRPINLDRDDTVVNGTDAGGPVNPYQAQQAHQFQQPSQPPQWAPTAVDQTPPRFEIVETDQYEEPLGEEARVIDNRFSATGVTRNVRASREWTRTMTVSEERTRTYGAELGGGPAWLKIKGSVEQELHRTYSTENQSKQTFAEEITITVPERTSVRLVIRWKRIWQRGVVRVTRGDGTVSEVPYQVVVNITFDQSQQDADYQDRPAAST